MQSSSSIKGNKRHHGLASRTIKSGLRKGHLRRMIVRAGIVRTGAGLDDDALFVFRAFASNLLQNVLAFTHAAKRRTITVGDVIVAYEGNKRRLYGFKRRQHAFE